MTLFRCVIRKANAPSSGDHYKWSNVYYVDRLSVTEAMASAQGLWTRERVFHTTNTYCYMIYVSDLVPNTSIYMEQPPPVAVQFGTFAASPGEAYHPSIVERVDLTVAASRPSRKFYRPPFGEGDITDGRTSSAGFNTALGTGMAQIVALPELRDVDGQTITGWISFGLTTRRLGRDARVGVPSPQGV